MSNVTEGREKPKGMLFCHSEETFAFANNNKKNRNNYIRGHIESENNKATAAIVSQNVVQWKDGIIVVS